VIEAYLGSIQDLSSPAEARMSAAPPSTAAGDAPVLKLLNVESAYGPIKAIRGRQPEGAPRRDRHRARQQRRGQDHDPEDHLRHHRPAQAAASSSRARTSPPATRPSSCSRAWCQVPEGREVFPLLSVHDNLLMGAYTRKDRDGVARDMEQVYGYFPILKERERQDAGLLSGGPAADAGDLARAGGRARD
jgi:branched-chain amino acid transport system ATP-binding protein